MEENQTAPTPRKLSFQGQQSDEVVLSTIYPSRLVLIADLGIKLIIVFFVVFAWWRICQFIPREAIGAYQQIVYAIIFVAYIVYLRFKSLSFSKIRTYLTDRRIVKFDPTVTFSVQRRTLFWKEVSKVREEEVSLWSLFQVGHVQIYSHESDLAADILIPYTPSYEDLASYIDKIVYITKEQPEQIKDIQPFEPDKKKRKY